MHVLLDEQLPRRLVLQIAGHDVRTVQQQGWAGLRNGDLLRRATEAGFEVFLTGDKNLQFLQNLTHSSLRVIVLVAPTNRFEDLISLIPRAIEAFSRCQPGEIIRISR